MAEIILELLPVIVVVRLFIVCRHVAEPGPVRPTTILEEPPYPGYHLQSAPHLQAPVDDVIAVGEDKAYAVNHHVTLQDVSQSSV